MLRLLADEHISPIVAQQGQRKYGMTIVALHNWRGGCFLGTPDSLFIAEAATEGLTLVSYDQRTLRPLLKQWAEQGVDHAGVIFVDAKTIAPQDFGSLVKALGQLWRAERHGNWKNRVVFLRRFP